jgi:thiamine biosynthesis lipoprotein
MLKKPFFLFCTAIVFLSAIISVIPLSIASAAIFKKSVNVMGTDLEVTVRAQTGAEASVAFDAVQTEMARIENEMSEWIEGSPVSAINSSAGLKPVHVPDELFKVIAASITVSEVSGGAFDISWAAMRGLWDFRKERVPTDVEINRKLPLVNYKNIEIDHAKKTVFLKKTGMAIGLGGIAKGYAVDMAMKAVIKLGIKNAIIRAGGDMRIQGVDEDGQPWNIGIKSPRNKEKFIAELPLTNISVSTSGDYERFFLKDNVMYHHIISPKTGQPARGTQSVTIIAPDTMTSDALSTAVFVLGPVAGLKLVEKLKGVAVVVVDDKGVVLYSSGFSEKNAPRTEPLSLAPAESGKK